MADLRREAQGIRETMAVTRQSPYAGGGDTQRYLAEAQQRLDAIEAEIAAAEGAPAPPAPVAAPTATAPPPGANRGGGTIVEDAVRALGGLFNPRRPVRGKVRKNTGFAQDFSAGEFVDARSERRLVTAEEQATFDRPDLVFADGTSWRTKHLELTEKAMAAGAPDYRSASAIGLAELAGLIATDRKLNLSPREIGYLWRIVDGYLAGVRDVVMYNPTRVLDQPLTQGLGNVATMTIGGRPGAIPRMLWRPGSAVDDIVAKHELGEAPRALGGLDPTLDAGENLPIRRFAEDKFGRALGAGAGKWAGRGSTVVAAETVRDLARTVDGMARNAVFATEYRKLVPRAWGDFRQEALGAARRKLGRPGEAQMRDLLDGQAGEWGPSTVYAEVKGALGDAGLAEDLSRKWASATGRMRDRAVGEVHRLFFTGYQRGGVETGMRRLFLFHYFATRQTALYASQGLRHPGLMNAYLNAVKGLDRYVEEHDLPETVKGFVRLFGTGYGFQMFLNPVLLLSTYLTFRDATPGEDGTNFFDFLKETVFLNPMIEGAIEYLGFYEDGQLTDPTGLRPVARLATALYNLGVARGLIPGDIAFADPIGAVEQEVREQTSGRLPGSEQVPAQDPGAVNQDKFFNLIVAQAMDDGATFEEATALATQAMLEGPGNALYDAAVDEYAKAGLAIEVTRLLGPWGVQGRVGVRDQTMVGREVVRGERAPDEDVVYPGTETQVAPGDTEANQDLGAARGSATATEEGRALGVQDDEYEALGSDNLDTWNAIAYGEVEAPVTINGTQYSAQMLAQLPDSMRKDLANAWASERGVLDDIETQRAAQDAYKEAHPEYAAFKDWQGDVYDAEGGPIAWWEAAAKTNPAAAAYLEQAKQGNPTESQLIGRLTSTDAYLAQQGIEPNVYDALPEAEGATATATTPAQQQQEGTDPATQIREDVQTYRAEVAAAAEVLAGYGISPYVFEYGSEEQQDLAEAILAQHGLEPPRLSGDAKGYLEWAGQQPAGADTSVEAYLRVRAGLEAEGAARTAPFMFGQGSDPLAGFLNDPLAMLMAGMGPGLSLEGDSYGYGSFGFPSTGTRLSRPQFNAGPSGAVFGGYGTRLPR